MVPPPKAPPIHLIKVQMTKKSLIQQRKELDHQQFHCTPSTTSYTDTESQSPLPSMRGYTHDDTDTDDDDIMKDIELYERNMRRMQDEIIPALSNRSYHIPGNTYYQDLIQYYCNNHPIISICCHHRQHPIGSKMRLLQLFGSIVFGITITNIMWCWFYFTNSDQNEPIFTLPIPTTPYHSSSNTGSNEETTNNFVITNGMIYLWTLGGILHAIYDNTIWYISVCNCCLSSQSIQTYRQWGSYAILTIIVSCTMIATLTLVFRSSADVANAKNDDEVFVFTIHENYIYEFLMSYITEFVLALFIYYPMIAFILFTGVLGDALCCCCGNITLLGGRPYAVTLAEKTYYERQQKENNRVL